MEKYVNWFLRKLGVSRTFEFTKRHKFILAAIIATIFLALTQVVPENLRYWSVAILALLTAGLTLVTLWEEFAGIKYTILLILPVFFVISVALFYYLLPVRWLTRVPVLITFGISMYLLFLTQNIYNIAAIRTIQLLRAAHAVGFLFTIITAFLLYNVVFALHLQFYFLAGLIFILTFPLLVSAVWSFELEEHLSIRVLVYSLVLSYIVAHVALALSFWPVLPIIGALATVSTLYVSLGLTQFHFTDRLSKRTIWEYASVAAVVFVLMLITTSWNG